MFHQIKMMNLYEEIALKGVRKTLARKNKVLKFFPLWLISLS